MRRDFRERDRSYSQRRKAVREENLRFLIVCEGEQTEPNYFREFRVPGLELIVEGVGDNTLSLVNKAVDLSQGEDFDQVWCVFDRDSFPAQNFNAALSRAANQAIRVAYSNEAFELWYLLHFNYYQSGHSRAEYRAMLATLLGRPYAKNDRGMYQALIDRQDTAIANAGRLLSLYSPSNPESDNPSTTVHLLVEELRRFAR